MSDNKRITDGRDRNGDGIIDAEFVEIGQEQPRRGRHDHFGYGEPPKQLSWWARLGKIGKVVAVLLSSILMLKGCDAFLGMVTREPASANSQAGTEGDYPLPIECAAEPEAQQGVCVQELVKNKTSTLSDRLLSKMDAATKDGAIELMTDAKIWNDNVDTVCSEQSRQRDPSADNAEKRQYYACLNTFLDRKMKEFK